MKQQDYQRQYYQLRKARGCFDCGKAKRPDSTRCHQCARDHAAKAKELYDTGKEAHMKLDSTLRDIAHDKTKLNKAERGKCKKITSNREAEEKLNKAARKVFLRVNQLSEKFVSPFGLGLGEL